MENASDWLEKLTTPLQRVEPAPGYEDTFKPLAPEPPVPSEEIDLEKLTHPLGAKTEQVVHYTDTPQPPVEAPVIPQPPIEAELTSQPPAAPPVIQQPPAEIPASPQTLDNTPLPFEEIGKDLDQIIPVEGEMDENSQPGMNMASIFPPSAPEAHVAAPTPPMEENVISESPAADKEVPSPAEKKLPPLPPMPAYQPDFLSGLGEKPEPAPVPSPTSEQGSKLPFDLNLEELEQAPHSVNIEAIPASSDTPDWLQQYAGEVGEIPDITSMPAAEGPAVSTSTEPAPQEPSPTPAAPPAKDAPDWLQNIIGDTPSSPVDLFKSVEEPLGSIIAPPEEAVEKAESDFAGPVPPAQLSKSGRLPDWLSELEESKPAPEASRPNTNILYEPGSESEGLVESKTQANPDQVEVKEEPELPSEFQAPAAVSEEGSAFPQYTPGGTLEETGGVAVPPKSEPPEAAKAKPLDAVDLFSEVEESQPASPAKRGSGDWLKSLPSLDDLAASPSDEGKAEVSSAGTSISAEMPPADLPPVPSSPKPDDQAVSSSPFEIAALPDWLETETEKEGADGKGGGGVAENLAPAEMPSWLQALKPQSKPAQIESSSELDGRLENQGPLAGFTGVIPGGAVATPIHGDTSDALPRLTASDVQRKYASLMDAVLTEETPLTPPVRHVEARKSRLIRLAATAASMLLILFLIVFGTQFLSMPGLFPLETVAFHNSLESIPADAKILIAIDYDPAFAGELQSISRTIINQLAVKNTGIIFISTLPSGPVMAEDLLQNVLASQPGYDANLSLNLGYLAGGANGLQELASRPTTVITRAWNRLPAWSQPAVAGIDSISNFDGIILVTDSFETGRAWIEQVEPKLEGAPLLVAASAQSSPLFQPYLNSGQVDGLIGGYAGDAAYEQILGIEDGMRLKWDAYMIGQTLMILVIIFGAIWQFLIKRPIINKTGKDNTEESNG